MEEVRFRRDLYKGTAEDYDRSRPPYPPHLFVDLLRRSHVEHGGRLLDLACGTGQIAFALHHEFDEVWAVDQEADAITFADHKAARLGITNIRWIAERAEDFSVETASFDLVAIGNAFHRLPRRAVAQQVLDWLRPGSHLALLWSDSPWVGQSEWQRALSEVIRAWTTRMNATSRVPEHLHRVLEEKPNQDVLASVGFSTVGRFEFTAQYRWTAASLAGFVFSTSVLSRHVLGDLAPDFASDLRNRLLAVEPTGQFDQTISSAYDLACRPGGR
jgi:ubiquinone/menaquinone biosynthesis C-methylase UbiE